MLSPKVGLPWVSELFLDSLFLRSADTSNIENKVIRTLQQSTRATELPYFRYISITSDGIDAGTGRGVKTLGPLPVDSRTEGADISIANLPSLSDGWPVYDIQPIRTIVQLNPSWVKLNRNNLMVEWEIRRADTNAVVVTAAKPYNAYDGNGIDIPHHTKELYQVKEFIIRCKLTMLLKNQAGEIWSGVSSIKINDNFDRSFPFVEWGPGGMYFRNEGTDDRLWKRITRSRIHRTAVAARCKHLKDESRDQKRFVKINSFNRKLEPSPFRYRASLPFAWEDLNNHRKILCDYCFFGGPTRTEAYPQEDWFIPNNTLIEKYAKNWGYVKYHGYEKVSFPHKKL